MLILVGVTVTVALNGGLFDKARNAAKGTQLERDKEELTLALVLARDEQTGELDVDKIKKELGENWRVAGLNPGPFLCTSKNENELIVDTNGEIINEEQLILSYKIVKITYDNDDGDEENSLGVYLMAESGFDYEQTFCDYIKEEFKSDENFNSWEEALQYTYKQLNEGKEGSVDEIKKMVNELLEIKDANYYITPEEFVKIEALIIKNKNNELKLIIENAYGCDRSIGFSIFENEKIPFTKITLTIGENTFKYSIGQEETASTIKVGDILLHDDGLSTDSYAVLYNDEKHGLQLVSLWIEREPVYIETSYHGGTYPGYNSVVRKMLNFCHKKKYLEQYASASRIVGGPFDEYDAWTDDAGLSDYDPNSALPADDSFYLEDCQQLEKLGLLSISGSSPNSYVLGSRIIKEEIDGNQIKKIYGVRGVSGSGEYGDNIYVELYNSNNEKHNAEVYIRPVIKINPDCFNLITFTEKIDGYNIYVFKEQ